MHCWRRWGSASTNRLHEKLFLSLCSRCTGGVLGSANQCLLERPRLEVGFGLRLGLGDVKQGLQERPLKGLERVGGSEEGAEEGGNFRKVGRIGAGISLRIFVCTLECRKAASTSKLIFCTALITEALHQAPHDHLDPHRDSPKPMI